MSNTEITSDLNTTQNINILQYTVHSKLYIGYTIYV